MNSFEKQFKQDLLNFFKRPNLRHLHIKRKTFHQYGSAGIDWENYLNTRLKSYNCPPSCNVTRNFGNNPGPDIKFNSPFLYTKYIDLKTDEILNSTSNFHIAQNIPCDNNGFPLEWNKLCHDLQNKMYADLLVLLTELCPAGIYWVAKNYDYLENKSNMQNVYTYLRDSLISNKKINGADKTTSNLGYYQLEWVKSSNTARLNIKRSKLTSFVSNHTGQLAGLSTPITSLFSNVA